MPSAFAVNDSQMVVCDHTRGAVVVYDREGAPVTSFGLLPDAQTRLSPLALAHFRGVAYVADMSLGQVLAISTASSTPTTEQGELILQIPSAGSEALGLPSAVSVTPDGRLLIGDATKGQVRVFTCDGQEVYVFDRVPGPEPMAPQGFAVDDIRDPGMMAEETFDPSKIRLMGRIHVADGRGAQVHMFNPRGEYVASYPEPGTLRGPSDVGISHSHRRVFVVDSPARRIHVFSYEAGGA
jgi:sugar lactone lactonase YvrE